MEDVTCDIQKFNVELYALVHKYNPSMVMECLDTFMCIQCMNNGYDLDKLLDIVRGRWAHCEEMMKYMEKPNE